MGFDDFEVCRTAGWLAMGLSVVTFGQAARAEGAVEGTVPAMEVTVRGTAPPRSASEHVVDRRQLNAAPHRDGSELLLTVPGVFVAQHGGSGEAHQIFFRGFDAQHGQDLELWVGGAPVNDVSNIHGQGYADLHFVIPEVVREIRSSPGNYSPEQGDFAVAGTLRYDLGYAEPGVTARTSLGSFGARRAVMLYHPAEATDETFGAAEVAATDGFGPSRAARHASGIGQVTYDFGSGVSGRLLASAYAGRYDSAGVLRLSDVESGRRDRFATYDGKQGGFSSRVQLVLELGSETRPESGRPSRWSLSPFLILRALQLRTNYTGFLTHPEGDSTEQRNDATTVGATASYQRRVHLTSDHDSLRAGLYLRSDGIDQSQHRVSLLTGRVTDDGSVSGVEAQVHALNAAGYLDASLHPIRRVTLRGGVRLDGLSYATEDHGDEPAGQFRSALGAQLSKRATFDIVALPGLRFLASYGEGFRSPQARSLGNGETTPFTRVVSYEGGARYEDGSRLRASLAVFHTRLSDDLAFDHATSRNDLVPGTQRTGLAANLSSEPTPWFVSGTSLTYTRATFSASDGRYAAGDLLPYVPQVVVRSDVALTPRWGKWLGYEASSHFGAGLTYLGGRPLPFGEMGHDVFLADVAARLRVGPLETGLDIFNLLDAAWYESESVYSSSFDGAASLLPVRHVTVGPPRSLLWSLALYV